MRSSRKSLTTAVLATATAVLVPAAAGAATLDGTVVGRPVAAGHSLVVPVLLSAVDERAAGAALARVVVPRAGGLRTRTLHLAPGDLRIGDRVTAGVPRITTRPRARVLRITRRAATLSFSRIDARRAAATAGVQRAIGQTQRLLADPMSGLDPATPATTNADLRTQLRAVRTDLNLLIADLRANADAFDATVAQIVAGRPADPARRATAERREATIVSGLTADAAAGRTAATALDDAVAHLDETLNAVGDPSSTPLPVEGVTTVSTLLHQVLDLLRGPGAGG